MEQLAQSNVFEFIKLAGVGIALYFALVRKQDALQAELRSAVGELKRINAAIDNLFPRTGRLEQASAAHGAALNTQATRISEIKAELSNGLKARVSACETAESTRAAICDERHKQHATT